MSEHKCVALSLGQLHEICAENGDTFTDTMGVLKSPNYPNNYGSNLDCSVTIQAPETKVMSRGIDYII